jgi:hypothetical protein
MMHRILFLLFSVFVVLACYHKKADALINVPRNTAITEVNSFTDLNVDSISVERFMEVVVKDDIIAHHIRNFYNSRNYQFAWFNEDG